MNTNLPHKSIIKRNAAAPDEQSDCEQKLSKQSQSGDHYYPTLILDPKKRRYLLNESEKFRERKLMRYLRHQRDLLLFAKDITPAKQYAQLETRMLTK